MNTIALYQISDELIAELDNAFDQETGELLPSFEEKRDQFMQKANQVIAYTLNQDATAAAIHEHIKTMGRKAKALATRSCNLRAYLQAHMKRTGVTEIKANDGTFTAKLFVDRDESVEIDDGIAWPAALCNEPKPPTPSKTKIKAAILAGEAISGARIVRHDRLQIK